MKGLNLLLVVLILGFYCFGASIMDSFVIYNGWRYVGEAEFAKLHQQDGVRIVLFFVMPLLVDSILMILLLWFRPLVIPKELVWMGIGCQAIGWLSSAFIQIPMQFQLDQGKNVALLEELIVTDWIRVIAGVGMMVVLIRMLWLIVKRPVI